VGVERTILLDCGPDFRQQALRADIRRLDAILFTHNHVDHVWGLDEVRRFNAVMGEPIDIYANRRTQDALRRVYAHILDRASNVNDSFVADLIMHTIEAGDTIEFFGVRVEAIGLLHGRLPILGYRIEAVADQLRRATRALLPLAYCTDVSAIPPETWPRLEGVRTLVLDALRHRHHPTHMTLEQAVDVAQRIGADATYLVHMSHDLGHAQTDASLPEGIHLAYDGLELDGLKLDGLGGAGG